MAEDEEILDKLNSALFGPADPADEDTESPQTGDLLAQLAAAVQHINERLAALEGNGGDDADSNQLAQLVGIVEKMHGRIETLENQPWKPWPVPNPVLASWVEEWLIPTFQLETTLTGWQDSPALLSELSALFGGYQQMVDPKANGWDALNWHQHRASAIARIEDHQRRHRSNPTSLGNWGSHPSR